MRVNSDFDSDGVLTSTKSILCRLNIGNTKYDSLHSFLLTFQLQCANHLKSKSKSMHCFSWIQIQIHLFFSWIQIQFKSGFRFSSLESKSESKSNKNTLESGFKLKPWFGFAHHWFTCYPHCLLQILDFILFENVHTCPGYIVVMHSQ